MTPYSTKPDATRVLPVTELQTEVQLQQIEALCAATIRALSAHNNIQYRGHMLHIDSKPYLLRVPYLHLDSTTDDLRDLRGVADSIALRLCHSDDQLHDQLAPSSHLQLLIFELLEQLRTESLAPNSLPGIKTNLRRRFLYWSDQATSNGLTENHNGLLIFTLAMMCWTHLHSEPLPELLEGLIESTRMALGPRIGSDLRQLKRHREDQQAYAQHALAIAQSVELMLGGAEANDADDDGSSSISEVLRILHIELQFLEGDSQEEEFADGGVPHIVSAFADQTLDYTIYTTEFDREIWIAETIREEKLKELRIRLDKRVREQKVNLPRLTAYMRNLFSLTQLSGWTFAQEEGQLDSSRLARLITSPDDHRIFRTENRQPVADCVVSILIDNSGSMNQFAERIAILVDVLSRSLELAGVKTEILGFTTGEWNGGRAYKKWLAGGRPKNPGRLSQVCHNLYKTADQPWRRNRAAIAGMLKPDLFREGVDGEAVQWAAKRLMQRTEERRILMVISDGPPMDTATKLTNPEYYLDRHLAQVVHNLESFSPIDVCGLGIDVDLGRYYRHNLAIQLDQELNTKTLFEITDLLAASQH